MTVADALGGRTPRVAVVLGAGGAARAVVLALEAAGVGEIVVANRDDGAGELGSRRIFSPRRCARCGSTRIS